MRSGDRPVTRPCCRDQSRPRSSAAGTLAADGRPGRNQSSAWGVLIRTMRSDGDFDAFYQASYHRLVGQLTILTGSLEDAEDAVQEAFARASTRWARLRDYDAPEAWVRRVAFNLATSGLRRARRQLAALARFWRTGRRAGALDRPAGDRGWPAAAAAPLPAGPGAVLRRRPAGGAGGPTAQAADRDGEEPPGPSARRARRPSGGRAGGT